MAKLRGKAYGQPPVPQSHKSAAGGKAHRRPRRGCGLAVPFQGPLPYGRSGAGRQRPLPHPQ